jgi:hypothetical protein
MLPVTDELVARAVKAAGVTDECPRRTDLEHVNVIIVRLLELDSSIVIEVWDYDTETRTQPDTLNNLG